MFETLIKIKYYNETISSFIGVSANLFAIYIVRKRTSKEMRQYSQTLLQNCCVDLFFNIVIFITKEQYEFMDGINICMLNGFAGKVPHPWDMLFHIAYGFGMIFCFLSMTIPFYCRYRVFCKGDMLSNYRVFTLYFFTTFICLAYICVYGLAFIPNSKTVEKTRDLLKTSVFLKDDGQVPIFIATEVSNPLFFVPAFLITTTITFGYVSIFRLGKAIHKTLIEKKVKLSPKSFHFHQQINRVLMLQALVPVFVGNISVIIYIANIFIKMSGSAMINSLLISWICVVNPFVAIFMVDIYRKAVLHPKKYLFSNDLAKPSINK